jgi:isopenicillin N synthase-like dioxygenase
MTALQIPVVDLAGWRSDPSRAGREVARTADRAGREFGFLHVVGHAIPSRVRDDMLAATTAFFDLPLDAKLAVRPPALDVNRGYSARGSEALAYSVGVERPPDLFEAFNIGPELVEGDPLLTHPAVVAERHRLFAPNIWPDALPAFETALVAWFAEAQRVAEELLTLFAVALGLPSATLTTHTGHSTDTLRVNHYRTAPGDPDPLREQLGMGEHTDYGMCTVLYADPGPGLQIIGPDGEWHDVEPMPGGLLVNLGDLMAVWTNDHWRSTLHRVLPPRRDPHRIVHRRSVAFFHDGDHDAVIECLPTCTSPDDPPRYPPITAGQHLMDKLMGPRELRASTATQTTGDRLG